MSEGFIRLPPGWDKPMLRVSSFGDENREFIRFHDGKFFVYGEETSDVERIGAAFVAYVRHWAEQHR